MNADAAIPDAPTPLGLYVHSPYCARICPYCDFNVYRNRDVDEAAWTDALIADIRHWSERIEPRPLASLYFGGGTPSLASPDLIGAVIDAADTVFGRVKDAEITLEANPADADAARYADYAAIGVNRLSLGVQSLRDDALRFLGRDHSAEDARRGIEQAQSAFSRMSFDLIYARPDQTASDWRAELEEALSFSPTHLSLYQLTIEPGTAFASAVAAKRWTPAADDHCAQQYEIAADLTAAAGLDAYEVSNHAVPGHQSRHNLIYWRYQDYIGVGPGAHGRVTIDGRRRATLAHKKPADYLHAVAEHGGGGADIEALSDEAQLIERLSMGLRLTEGVPLYADDVFYNDERRVAQLTALIDDGFLSHHCGTLRATPSGRRMLNRVLYELLGQDLDQQMDALSDIAHTIQLAVAPVFLLAGIGALLNVVTARLGRAVDRARSLEEALTNGAASVTAERIRDELRILDRRMVLAQRSITLCTLSALLVCVLVALLFIADLTDIAANAPIASLFIAAMAVLIVGLSYFIAEVTIATRMLRVRAEIFMND